MTATRRARPPPLSAISSRSNLCESASVTLGAQSFHLNAQQRHSCSNAFVLLRNPGDFPVDRALVDKALQLFIRTQTQHLFAATGCISFPKIKQDEFEQGLEFKRRLGGKRDN
jgi:hypothetical protein